MVAPARRLRHDPSPWIAKLRMDWSGISAGALRGIVKDNIGPGDTNGLRAALREKPAAGHRKFSACVAFSGFETTGQRVVGEEHRLRLLSGPYQDFTDKGLRWLHHKCCDD